MDMIFSAGKTYRRVSQPNDPKDYLDRVFVVVGRDPRDNSVEFVYYKDYMDKREAEEMAGRLMDSGTTRTEIESSGEWVEYPRDTRSREERMTQPF